MSLVELPETWIVLAAVLVLIAVVLFVLSWRSRRRSSGPAVSPDREALAVPRTHGDDVEDPVTAPVMAAPAPRTAPVAVGTAETGTVDPGQVDPGQVDPGQADPGRVEAGGPAPFAPAARRYVPADGSGRDLGRADPARAGDRAKDRLLGVLLTDPDGAVDVVAALSDDEPASGSAAASLLRAGLSPAQVARLCRVEEGDLAHLIARDLGLIAPERGQGSRTGASRTTEPGRAWASAGSASGSTTPTTG